jgi:hypothetical protein
MMEVLMKVLMKALMRMKMKLKFDLLKGLKIGKIREGKEESVNHHRYRKIWLLHPRQR